MGSPFVLIVAVGLGVDSAGLEDLHRSADATAVGYVIVKDSPVTKDFSRHDVKNPT
jgi:hypothetical protein